jgi:hypothetical chaperone protein
MSLIALLSGEPKALGKHVVTSYKSSKYFMNFIGIDFGTSNSLASLVTDGKIEFVEFPDGGISNPTILYYPARGKQFYVGNDAVMRYLSHLEESDGAGRLMLSIKSLLPEADFDYTTVAGHGRQTVEDMVAKFLATLKQFAEQKFAKTFEGVVLGRPVHFSELAVSRLERAAKLAGFTEVIFWLEPVAAALSFEMDSTRDELVCVVDIGGGTSDVCVIETSPSRSLQSDRLNDIKAVSGVYLAGDALSSEIMKHKLAPRFGAGSTYKSMNKTMPFPGHIINKLAQWHRINLLRAAGDVSTISSIVPYSNRPKDVERLLNLIKHHYGFELFRAIDTAKRHLSDNEMAVIKFNPLDLAEEVRLDEFENMIGSVVDAIKQSIFDSLSVASVKPSDITQVLLTGGTSQVPKINHSIIDIFGREKILRPDFFSSVATGLGHIASRFQ